MALVCDDGVVECNVYTDFKLFYRSMELVPNEVKNRRRIHRDITTSFLNMASVHIDVSLLESLRLHEKSGSIQRSETAGNAGNM